MKQFEMVVIACERDREVLPRLIGSVFSHFEKSSITRINIIWNHPDHVRESKHLRRLRSELEHMRGKNNTKPPIRWLQAQDIDPKLGKVIPGSWYSQQYLKLKAAEWVDSEYYLVNDCKDYYTETVPQSDWFPDGDRAVLDYDRMEQRAFDRIVAQTRATSPHLDELGDGSANGPTFGYAWLTCRMVWNHYMDNDARTFQTRGAVFSSCTTPYIFHTKTVRRMNTELYERLGGFFPFLFQTLVPEWHTPLFTEFHIYSQYLEAQRLTERLYTPLSRGIADGNNPFLKVYKERSRRR